MVLMITVPEFTIYHLIVDFKEKGSQHVGYDQIGYDEIQP